MKKPNTIEGKPLILSVAVGEKYVKSIKAVMRSMNKDMLKGIEECYLNYAQDSDLPENGNLVSQSRILINYLLNKYNPIFAILAKKITARMVNSILKNSADTLKMSLSGMDENLVVKTDFMSERLKDITAAATQESVSLIKLIPQTYFSSIQKAVMNSISVDGRGIADLKPYLTKLYIGNERRAELTALDLTRKVYQSVQAERMQQLGVKKFKWLHSGGGREPRKLHKELSGQIFSFDDPPYIGDMYGQKVYGLPGHLPNCGCRMCPVLDFGVKDES